MSFSTQLTSDLDAFFNTGEFAEAITYAGSSINAVVSYGENLDEQTGSAVAKATIFVKVSDVSNPTYRDIVIINSTTYYVRRIIEGNGLVWKLQLETDERPVI